MQSSTSRLWTGQFIIIILTSFIFFLALQMLTAGFPAYITELTHNPTKGGIMTTVFMLAAIISRPVIGIIMHKVNMKKILSFILIGVLFTLVISYNQSSMTFLVVLRLLQGIGFGVATTLLATMATNIIPNNRIGEGIGYFGISTSLGTTLGPMFALTLLHHFTFNTMIFVNIGLLILTCLFSFIIKNDTPVIPLEKPIKKINQHSSIWQYAFDKRALIPCFLVFIFYITFSGIVNFINGIGSETHLAGKVSLFFLINAIVTLAIRPFSGKIYDQIGHKYLILPASICGIIGLILISITQHFSLLFVAAVFYGIAYGIMQPTFQAWAVSLVSPDKKGTANAMAFSFMDLGMAFGAATLGGVAGQIGYRSMFGFSSILIVLLIILYLFAFKKLSRRAKEDLSLEKQRA
ncbi:MFS transporter [Terrilactibacillus sp. BCM23-1]|uniref:MFS transporter n=1 Tax=Terrilactibacillus tamarindi TaxID=2599694 RepID=A0A6N8CT75_9BACI|nr:MFS transporter [Terrilactibacillus tamarindi]MTT31186.1 MFS transporter [Terrilactibacillus tamarindi]